jgi:hypothetical protein
MKMAATGTRDCVLFATERYAWPILAPLAAALREAGYRPHTLAWGNARDGGLAEVARVDVRAAAALRPCAVFSAANDVPAFLTGAKVQLFHGFNVEKRSDARGHFRIRGLYDLYCTQGPATTAPFRDLAARARHFAVVDTGWTKLDPLFAGELPLADALRAPAAGRRVLLFASTFTESLSAAPRLFDAIAAEVARGDRYWLLTLHPKTAPELVARYRALAGPNARFVESEDLVAAERAADALLADTTSVVSEFVVQRKPVATFRNRAPKPHMLDFDDPARLPEMLALALDPPADLRAAIAAYADFIHPSRDGHASRRVVAATEALVRGELGKLRRKPPSSWLRRLQLRADAGYWGR